MLDTPFPSGYAPNMDNWNEVMKLAEKHGLIIHAAGGVAVLATHEVQEREGIYEWTQQKNGKDIVVPDEVLWQMRLLMEEE